ncbi:hypothetical protein H5410_010910 [Solanum commersonii]|uniref:Uncharacterized protein n=1 Tax=Solanum commersonii TaxID=4109 RepID=A0A9J6AMV5_SOLCO|nr:hypothetical protein H5410_010910 [Solanum commersonii]
MPSDISTEDQSQGRHNGENMGGSMPVHGSSSISQVGYPPDFKSKRKIQSASSANSGQAHFSYGGNTNVPAPGWVEKLDIAQPQIKPRESSSHHKQQASQAELEVK